MNRQVAHTVRRIPMWRLRKWLPAFLVASLSPAAFAQVPAAPTTPPATTAPMTPKAAEPKAAEPPEKTISFVIEDKPWTKVMEWFGKESGLTFVSDLKPTGTVTIKPSDPNRKYTMGEIVDLLNEALASTPKNKYVIVRKSQTFAIYPADEKLDPAVVPQIDIDELKKKGNTEMVSVVVPLKTLVADDMVPYVRQLKGPFGEVNAFGSNQLIVTDKAGNVRNIIKQLKELEDERGIKDQIVYPCKYIRAAEAADTLKTLLSDSTTNVVQSNPGGAPAAPGFGGFQPQMQMPIQDPRMRTTQVGRFREVKISVQERTNTVMLTGPADKISAAEHLLKQIDIPQGGAGNPQTRVIGPPTIQFYPVPAGTADAVAKTLAEIYKSSTIVRIQSLTTRNEIMVYAPPADHLDIAAQLRGTAETKSSMSTEVIPIGYTKEPKEVIDSLKRLFPTTGQVGEMILEERTEPSPAVIVKGTTQQIADVKTGLMAIGIPVAGQGGGAIALPGAESRLRSITIENGSAATLAEELSRMMRQMGKNNPVQVQNLNSPPPAPTQPPANPMSPAPAPAPKQPTPNRSSYLPQERSSYLTAQLIDPTKPPPPEAKPVYITVSGNRLIITSDDPEALDLVSSLARLYISQSKVPSESLFEIIRLKNASAEEAAKAINEVFNGPPQQGMGGGRGGGGGGPLGFLAQFAGMGAAAPSSPASGRVRVYGEKQSNSLIVVKASPIDLATIRGLLSKAIDNGEVEPAVALKTRLIPLQYAAASDIATTLKDVYASIMQSRSGAAQRGGGFPFPFPGAQPQGGGQSSTPQLTIGVDERTNSLIVNCNDTVYSEIELLVKTLDQGAMGQNDIIKVIKPKIDPLIAQQAIAALTGQQMPQRQGTMGGPMGGTMGGQFGNRGGFGGGMGGMGGFGGGGMPGFGGGMGGGRGFGGGGIGGGRGFGGGGGGPRGGGGGRGGNRSNRRSDDPPAEERRAPSPFDHADMDVPQTSRNTIYDPENDVHNQVQYTQVQQPMTQPGQPVQPGQAGRPSPLAPPTGRQTGAQGNEIAAPGSNVRVDSLDTLGLLIIRAGNQQDMEEIMKLIANIEQNAQQGQISIELVPVKNQDATSLVNILNNLFSRVQLGANSSTILPATNRPGGTGGFGGFGGGIGGALGGLFGGGAQASAQTSGAVFLLPLPRFNAILVAVPQGQREKVLEQIKTLDVPNGGQSQPTAFALKKASAQIIAQQIQNFYNSRYTGETQTANQVRVTYDVSSNTVFVQASPADIRDIAELINMLDTSVSKAENELRVFKLKYAYSDEIAQVLAAAISSSAISPQAQAAGVGTTGAGGFGGGLGGLGGGFGGGGGLGGGGFGGGGQFATGGAQRGGVGGLGGIGGGIGGGASNASNAALSSITTKSTTLRFYSSQNGQVTETGLLEDVHITPDGRINGIVVAAPAKTMRLIEKLLEELDTPSAARSDVKVFTLKKADANNVATLISQLFSSSTTGGAAGGLGGGGGFGGAGGLGGAGGVGSTTNAMNRPLITLTGDVSAGATLLNLRISTDARTNSLIVAGSVTDLETIRAIIGRLEDSEVPQLMTKVYRLRNQAAADVQTAVQTFMQNKLTAEQTQFNAATIYQILQRTVYIQPEPVSQTLLIAADPRYFDEIVRLIEKIDAPPPQVYVQVLIAEVQLSNLQEFGVEFGIQSPVLFARSSTTTSPGTPGFNFNTTAALPNTTVGTQPGVVGFQGLGNLGVGRSGSAGVGGFVFSAASDTFNLLIRAVQAQSRLDVLSRPQLLLTDNQTGFFQVGQQYPILQGATTTATVGVTQNITYVNTGITLRITPRINPDGRVMMRVEPNISQPSPTLVTLGNGNVATAFDTQAIETTVLASDGETLVIGGLIRKSDQKLENRIPWLGSLPYVGAAFRYRTQNVQRRELIFIITPYLVRNDEDKARITAEEARKMNWSFKDVADIHSHGLDVLTGTNPFQIRDNCAPPGVNVFTGPAPSAQQLPIPAGVVPDHAPESIPPAGGYPQYPQFMQMMPQTVAPNMAPAPVPSSSSTGSTAPSLTIPGAPSNQTLPGGVVPDSPSQSSRMGQQPVTFQPVAGYAPVAPVNTAAPMMAAWGRPASAAQWTAAPQYPTAPAQSSSVPQATQTVTTLPAFQQPATPPKFFQNTENPPVPLLGKKSDEKPQPKEGQPWNVFGR